MKEWGMLGREVNEAEILWTNILTGLSLFWVCSLPRPIGGEAEGDFTLPRRQYSFSFHRPKNLPQIGCVSSTCPEGSSQHNNSEALNSNYTHKIIVSDTRVLQYKKWSCMPGLQLSRLCQHRQKLPFLHHLAWVSVIHLQKQHIKKFKKKKKVRQKNSLDLSELTHTRDLLPISKWHSM